MLITTQAYATNAKPEKKAIVKSDTKLKKLNLTEEQLKQDEEIKKRHSKQSTNESHILNYMKLNPITIKFGMGLITDSYDDHTTSDLWRHNGFKSPVIDLGFYMHHHWSFCRLHLFYGLDLTYLESVEEIASGKVKLVTKGILISPEVGVTFHPMLKPFGFSASLKMPLIRETQTQLKTATYRKDLDDDVGTYEVRLWAHWYMSPSFRPYIRYSFGEDTQNSAMIGVFYGFQ